VRDGCVRRKPAQAGLPKDLLIVRGALPEAPCTAPYDAGVFTRRQRSSASVAPGTFTLSPPFVGPPSYPLASSLATHPS
jgi:hypothetical protein